MNCQNSTKGSLCIIVDLLVAIIAPLFIPLFYHYLSGITKPSLNRVSPSITGYSKDVNVFMKELPTAFIGNAIWGMTYRIDSGVYVSVWTILYCFIALFSCLPLLYSRNVKKNNAYQIFVVLVYILLSILSMIRIFNIIK